MENKTKLQAEIDLLENRLRSLPDDQVIERIEIRKKLIKKYMENSRAENELKYEDSSHDGSIEN